MTLVLRTKEETEKDEAGGYTVSKVVQVHDDAKVAITANDVRTVLPALGASIAIGPNTAWLRSRSLRVVPRSGRRVWIAQLEYSPVQVDASFTATGSRISAATVDMWRAAPNAPANLNTPATTDMAGTPVDSNGDPLTQIIPRQALKVRNYLSSVPYATYRAAVGTRNNGTFLGIAAGYLLYMGADDERVGENRYEVNHEFVFDGWAHLRQKAKLDPDGRPILGTADGNGVARAAHVYWVQPFQAVSNFGSLGIVL